MTATLFLYLLPLAGRFALFDPSVHEWWDVALSILPLVVVAPSSYLPRCFADETEHVVRHGLYALSFTVAAGVAVRWDVIVDRLQGPDEATTSFVWAFVAYLAIGAATLWWFCFSHMLENAQLCGRSALLYTHQGDVVVLPLTLVAIATFAESLPDDIFRFSRAVPFYVPIIVAWATMHFLAFTGFGTNQTTTHTHPHFGFYAKAGLVVATGHLVLLEMRAPSLAFQIFPPVAALLSQFTYRAEKPPELRPNRMLGTLVAAGGMGSAMGAALATRWAAAPSYGISVVAVLGCAVCLPPLAGRTWYVPGVGYSSLLSAVLLSRLDPTTPMRPQDLPMLIGGYTLALFLVAKITPATWQRLPPHPSPPTDLDARPQTNLSRCTFSSLSVLIHRMFPLGRCTRRRYADRTDWLEEPLGGPRDPNCPAALHGLWWMEGNTFAQELLCVQNKGVVRWNKSGEGSSVSYTGRWCPQWRGITRSGSIGGLLGTLTSIFICTEIEALTDDEERPTGWIRTQVSILPGLHWFSATYWLHPTGPDEMVRVVYDAEGRVTWQYNMRRIARSARAQTRHYDAFLQTHGGDPYWVWW